MEALLERFDGAATRVDSRSEPSISRNARDEPYL
eukprot:SAG11_NODE_2025_length_3908_cov_1.787346_1_plen_33_part_10